MLKAQTIYSIISQVYQLQNIISFCTYVDSILELLVLWEAGLLNPDQIIYNILGIYVILPADFLSNATFKYILTNCLQIPQSDERTE